MNKLLYTLISVSLMFICTFAANEKSKWDRFSKNMDLALTSSNPGVQLAALKLIIRFNDKLDDQNHFFNLISELNDSGDERIRKTALIALYKVDQAKAVTFFDQRQNLEKNQVLREKMALIVMKYHKDTDLASAEVDNCYNICSCCNFVSLTY